jgi:hypothetical protein
MLLLLLLLKLLHLHLSEYMSCDVDMGPAEALKLFFFVC